MSNLKRILPPGAYTRELIRKLANTPLDGQTSFEITPAPGAKPVMIKVTPLTQLGDTLVERYLFSR